MFSQAGTQKGPVAEMVVQCNRLTIDHSDVMMYPLALSMLLYTDPEKLRTCYVGVRRSTVSTFLADQQQLLLLANLLLDSWTIESRTEGKAA